MPNKKPEPTPLHAQAVIETVRGPLLVLDGDLRVISANHSFYETFQVSPVEAENRLIYDLVDRQWDIPELRRLLEEILPKRTQLNDYEVSYHFPQIGLRTLVINARVLPQEDIGKNLILLSIEDLTERQQADEQLRALPSQLLAALEDERKRLALELHDAIGQNLLSLKLRLASIYKQLPQKLPQLEELGDARDFITNIIEQVRYISYSLVPPLLDLGLSHAIYKLGDEFCKYFDIEVCTINLLEIDGLFSKEEEIHVFRIIQESLANIGKHAHASEVKIEGKQQEDHVSFMVADNGKGFKMTGVLICGRGRGLGLSSMRERARLLGGSLGITSQEGHGTKISFTIPLSKKL